MAFLDIHDPASYEFPNWAEYLGEDELKELGIEVCEDTEADERSRDGWMADQDQWLTMSQQIIEHKTTPWDGASNVKFPLSKSFLK